MTMGYAPGKVILFGEHAVVYGRPAIAIPVTQVQAQAEVQDVPTDKGIVIVAEDLSFIHRVGPEPTINEQARPLETIVLKTLEWLHITPRPAICITVRSTVPLARGLGSSAAVSTAIVRALAAHFSIAITPQEVSELVYQTEIIHHGTPSGIDNTVIAFEQPVYFVRGKPVEPFQVGRPFHIAIADTGIPSSTKVVVGDVRTAWEANPERYEALFNRIGAIVQRARIIIERGESHLLGPLMDENHQLLRALGVSSRELDLLAKAARKAGAGGAKLSGAGRGGNLIALVTPKTATAVERALREAGARDVLITAVS